ncbi:MAG: hypothetical protein P1U82_08670 [Verrucomicrobiales bacterium]|nr:hypothetical protein [Verrucomicrobiales bacterium]
MATRYATILHSSDTLTETIYVRLSPPMFSMDSSSCCENLYDKSLLLKDPSGTSASTIVYTVDGGSEQTYASVINPLDTLAGAINIRGKTRVSVSCQSLGAGLVLDRCPVTHMFAVEPYTEMDPPVITLEGGTFSEYALITIIPPVSNPEAQVIFTRDGSDPTVNETGNIINRMGYKEPLSQ